MVNRTVVGGNQIPMLRHNFQKRKKKKKTITCGKQSVLWKAECTTEIRKYLIAFS